MKFVFLNGRADSVDVGIVVYADIADRVGNTRMYYDVGCALHMLKSAGRETSTMRDAASFASIKDGIWLCVYVTDGLAWFYDLARNALIPWNISSVLYSARRADVYPLPSKQVKG